MESISKVQTFHVIFEEPEVLQCVSSYPKALRVVAAICRFLKNSLRDKAYRKNFKTRILSKDELVYAKTCPIVLTQKQYLPEDYKALSESQPVGSKSVLRPLNPV